MTVHDLDFKGVGIDPPEADAPTVVDPNAVLPVAINPQGLQAITWNRSEVRQGRCCMDVVKLPFRHGSNALKLPTELAPEHLLGLPVAERPDHAFILLPCCA